MTVLNKKLALLYALHVRSCIVCQCAYLIVRCLVV